MSAQSRIRDLVLAKLAGRKIDVVGFVNDLLAIASETGEMHCCLASKEALRFEFRGETCNVELDASLGKLRMICARVSVLCNESSNGDVSPYGGEGVIRVPSHNGKEPHQWIARFKNTPDEQEFTIIPAKIPTTTPR